jgi:hypothetical protein
MDTDDLSVIEGGGSRVIDIEVGQNFALADRPGLCTVVQFESSEEVVVREFGTKILFNVPVSSLRSLTEPAAVALSASPIKSMGRTIQKDWPLSQETAGVVSQVQERQAVELTHAKASE